MKLTFFSLAILLFINTATAQDIELYTQFNGQYDYTAIGNTLNTEENDVGTPCTILTSSSATLSLTPSQSVKAAYLYWAGSGTGDFSVQLNNEDITPDRTFDLNIFFNTINTDLDYFSAFADVTSQVVSTGNGTYTLSDLDLTQDIIPNCQNATNFGGWSIIIVYEDPVLPQNQISIFDGLQEVSLENTFLSFNLTNLNIINDQDAKIGFLAWEGDAGIAVNESLQINGNTVSNPPLNPATNAFNSTNSFTNSSSFYNMDLDFYDIENYVSAGDVSAFIELTSGQDLIMVNNIVTVFNSELPDPSPKINYYTSSCQSREILVDYTINNFNATDDLPADSPILFFADGVLVGQTVTQNIIPMEGSEDGQITLTIPTNIPNDFTLEAVVNIDTDGSIVYPEINENNNTSSINVSLLFPEITEAPEDIVMCDDVSNDGIGVYDFTENLERVQGNQSNVSVSFHTSLPNAENNLLPIPDITAYETDNLPREIFVRVGSGQDNDCYEIASFMIDLYYMPVANQPGDRSWCISANEETQTIPLSYFSDAIINNQPNAELTYHTNEQDAENNNNTIEEVEIRVEKTTTVYARLENPEHTDCYTLVSFQIIGETGVETQLDPVVACNEGDSTGLFDLTEAINQLDNEGEEETYFFFDSYEMMMSSFPVPIFDIYDYEGTDGQQLFFYNYIETPFPHPCMQYYVFELQTENCPPEIPEGFSPNGDGINDTFNIAGLYGYFDDFELKVFSRYGNIIYEGDQEAEQWDGTSKNGKLLPTGVYYYTLATYDTTNETYTGWVYLNK